MVFFTKESMYGAIVLVLLSFLDRVFDILLATEPFKLLTLSFDHMRKCKQQQ